MKDRKKQLIWPKIGLYVFWATLGVFALSFIASYGTQMMAQAAVEDGESGTGSEALRALACDIFSWSGTLVVSLAIFLTISAGIVYATSQGEGGGDSGIGLAKSMIIAAISGIVLYILGFMLLNAVTGLTVDESSFNLFKITC